MGARLTLIAAVALSVAVGWTGAAPAQTGGAEYTIGPGDVLSVSVWRHPELTQQVTVRSNGQATFAPVGDLRAAGATPTELSRELVQRLRDYTGETTQVSVTVATFNSRTVYLTGQVTAPGRYSFEQIPDLLQLISQAGGPLPGADLSGVTIVRSSPTGPRVIKADVGAYMRGTGEPLPSLQPGDSVDVPSMIGAGGMSGPGLIYVLGEVTAPGPYPTTEGMDVLQAISLAGGTTPEGELKSVGVVMNTAGGQSVALVDAERIMRDGTASPFLLQVGDRVVVPKATPSIPGAVWAGTTAVLTSVRDVVSAYMLYLTVDRELEDRKLRQLQIDALERANEEAAGQ